MSTKKQWRAKRGTAGVYHITCGDQVIAGSICGDIVDDIDTAQVNANMMAASPELLEACRAVIKAPHMIPEEPGIQYGSVVRVDLPGAVWDALLAAISKAKGSATRPRMVLNSPHIQDMGHYGS